MKKIIRLSLLLCLVFVTLRAQETTINATDTYYCPPCNSHCDDLTFAKAVLALIVVWY